MSEHGRLASCKATSSIQLGYPDPRQTTSARDMALLAQALWHDYPQHYHFFATRRIRFGRYDLPTINGFLTSYRGADGLKTGTTCDAGYNLVASAERDGLRLIGVVLGASDSTARSANMARLLNEGFSGAVAEHGIDIATLRPSPSDPRRVWMGASACQSRVSALSASLPALPGWGLVLGAYAQDFRARRGIELAKASLSLRPASVCQPISANQQLSCSGMQNTTVPFWLGSMRIRQHLPA